MAVNCLRNHLVPDFVQVIKGVVQSLCLFDRSLADAFGISRPKWLKARAYQRSTNRLLRGLSGWLNQFLWFYQPLYELTHVTKKMMPHIVISVSSESFVDVELNVIAQHPLENPGQADNTSFLDPVGQVIEGCYALPVCSLSCA